MANTHLATGHWGLAIATAVLLAASLFATPQDASSRSLVFQDPGGRESSFCQVDATAPGNKAMERHLSPELRGKLALAADRRGVSVEVLARVGLGRAVDYATGSSTRSRPGSPRSGQVLTHDAVEKRLATKLTQNNAAR